MIIPIAVKLNGVIEAMNPSNPLYSSLFQTPDEFKGGCDWYISIAAYTAYR